MFSRLSVATAPTATTTLNALAPKAVRLPADLIGPRNYLRRLINRSLARWVGSNVHFGSSGSRGFPLWVDMVWHLRKNRHCHCPRLIPSIHLFAGSLEEYTLVLVSLARADQSVVGSASGMRAREDQ